MGNFNNYNDVQQNPLNYNPQMMPQMAQANFMGNQSFSSLNNPSLSNINNNNMTSLPVNPYNNMPPPSLDKTNLDGQLQHNLQMQQNQPLPQMSQIQAQNQYQLQNQQFQQHIQPQQQFPQAHQQQLLKEYIET